jgi:cytochrome c biogenesis protein CcdA
MLDYVPEFVPNAERLASIFSTATSPTFFLGAVAAFASLMTVRITSTMARVRELNAISDEDASRAHLKADLDRLMRRAILLKDGIFAALISGVCATVLLAIIFTTEFLGLKYAYGAAVLFIVATIFLGLALVRFAQEVAISLDEPDKY